MAIVRFVWAAFFGLLALAALALAPATRLGTVPIALLMGGLAAWLVRGGRSERPHTAITTMVVLGLIGSVVYGAIVVLSSATPETPENAVIALVLDLQEGGLGAAPARICAARRHEFGGGESPFRASVEALDGFIGLSDEGWPSEVEGTHAVVYGAAGDAGPAVKPWFSPPMSVWAVDVRRENGRWRVCGVASTRDTLPGFDLRSPCAAGQTPQEDPHGCRAS